MVAVLFVSSGVPVLKKVPQYCSLWVYAWFWHNFHFETRNHLCQNGLRNSKHLQILVNWCQKLLKWRLLIFTSTKNESLTRALKSRLYF